MTEILSSGLHGLGGRRAAPRAVAAWLLVVALLVFAMVVLGGVTRLTESGLSMVDWRPLTGWLPPSGEGAWQAAFAEYQAYPEYQQVNQGMTLAEFKVIYGFEYGHRLLGRLIGLAFFVPLAWFGLTRRLPSGFGARLAVVFGLGAAQGLLGWYMVQSGLVDRPDVSPYRLTAHLGLAAVIFATLIWTALDLLGGPARRPASAAGAWLWPAALTALIGLQILAGGLVAGLNAGLHYNSFPLMDGEWVPAGWLAFQPVWLNFVENPITVQFDHRVLGLTVVLGAALWALWWLARHRDPELTGPTLALLAAAFGQAGLGIATLILVVPIPLAAAHQAGALILLGLAVWLTHRARGLGPRALRRGP